MKRKYAEYYYSVKNDRKGFFWQIYSDFKSGSEVLQSSLDADPDDQYYASETAARMGAIEAIQDHYSY